MATVLLAAAGSAVGGAFGGTVLGIGGAALGKAVGATVGSLIDQRILGSGARAVEVGKARSLRLQTSTEGTAVPRIFGRMRVSGQVIWSTRFLETVRTTNQGGKATGGQTVREFSYSISVAVALCEGPVERLGRIWADGKPFLSDGVTMRLHTGAEDQLPDPKIEAVEGVGRVPAYRGTAYVVFEDLPLGAFGNRIPQFAFEVYRSPNAAEGMDPDERGTPVRELVTGVALSPGSGEFALETEPVQTILAGGQARYANVNNPERRPDLLVALDQLDADLDDCGAVSLVVSWFGDDLRAGQCQVEPRAEVADRKTRPLTWSVAGLGYGSAKLVSTDGAGRPHFGGTPSDHSVIRSIQEMNARGKSVMVYPFLLMDVPLGNGLPDPYGANEQAAFPWRGRITLDPVTADQTEAAANEVAAFFGSASASDFTSSGETVSYSGPVEWTWRRFALHLAALAKAAGGVESFCIGSELIGLTTIRSAKTSYPAVDQLVALAAEVRQLLPGAKLTYAADWSEYFGHQPTDGSGDAIFHLDPLWASAEVDFVGIDDYTPLSDWRHSGSHLDREAGAASVYSLPYLKGQVEGGEYYDWFYASDADRDAQQRTTIQDGAHGEDWVFRPKDIRNWWSNAHHNRIDGVRQASPTGWVPGLKPVRLTETGCPAVDLGANQPNLFVDAKSSESALPYGSFGARDDEMQRRFLQAKLGHWAEPGVNPVSAVYGGPMIENILVWTWDARPWPDFPLRESVWADGPAHRVGHWITGRVSAGSLAEVVAEICISAGLTDFDVSGLYGTVQGYLIDETGTAREALQPLMLAYGFDAVESAGRIVFAMRGQGRLSGLDETHLVTTDAGAPVERVRESAGSEFDAVRLGYMEAETDYRVGAAEAWRPGGSLHRVGETSLPIALSGSVAAGIAERWLAEASRSKETARFSLPPSQLAIEAADLIRLAPDGREETWRIDRIIDAAAREVEAVRVEPTLYLPVARAERGLETPIDPPAGPVEAVFMDLPVADGSEVDHQPWLAVRTEPWTGPVALWRSSGAEFEPLMTLRKPAVFGVLADPLSIGEPDRWQNVRVTLTIPSGTLASAERLAVLNGSNRLAIERGPGEWEIVQFRDAVLSGADEIEIGRLLRGQRGTEALAGGVIAAGARVVLLDNAMVPIPIAPAEVGLERIYRIGPARFDHSHGSYVEVAHAGAGIGLRPFAPVHLVVRNENAGLAIDWIRSTRIAGDSWTAAEVPLGEEAERYRVRILSGGAELRRAEVAVPRFVYTAAMQTADAAAGALDIRVAQHSTLFGYGPERAVTSHV